MGNYISFILSVAFYSIVRIQGIHYPVDRNLGCLQDFSSVNDIGMNILICIFYCMWVKLSLVSIPTSGIAESEYIYVRL